MKNHIMKQVTIKDVASKAGVSISTVSRVFNNNYPVSKEVKERVMEIADQLSYRPNSVARSLKTQKTDIIGYVVPDISRRFYMEIGRGIENVVSPYDYNIIMASSDSDIKKESKLLTALLEERVAALVIATADKSGSGLQNFIDIRIPVIMVDRYPKDFRSDCVLEHNYDISYRLTEILLDHGHTNIAAANVLLSVSTGLERYNGFMAALKAAKIKPNHRFISGSFFTSQDSEGWVHKIFSADNPPTALFCANSTMARGALVALKKLSIRIPEDVSVVSYGELEMADLVDIKLTSGVQKPRQMGIEAGKMVLERIKNGVFHEPITQYVPTDIIDGTSVKKIN